MTNRGPTILSPAEIRLLDAKYRGFPDFSEWADATVATDLWDGTQELLAERRGAAPAGVYDELVEQAMRAATVDTGAIEGLYEVDRGSPSRSSRWLRHGLPRLNERRARTS